MPRETGLFSERNAFNSREKTSTKHAGGLNTCESIYLIKYSTPANTVNANDRETLLLKYSNILYHLYLHLNVNSTVILFWTTW